MSKPRLSIYFRIDSDRASPESPFPKCTKPRNSLNFIVAVDIAQNKRKLFSAIFIHCFINQYGKKLSIFKVVLPPKLKNLYFWEFFELGHNERRKKNQKKIRCHGNIEKSLFFYQTGQLPRPKNKN